MRLALSVDESSPDLPVSARLVVTRKEKLSLEAASQAREMCSPCPWPWRSCCGSMIALRRGAANCLSPLRLFLPADS